MRSAENGKRNNKSESVGHVDISVKLEYTIFFFSLMKSNGKSKGSLILHCYAPSLKEYEVFISLFSFLSSAPRKRYLLFCDGYVSTSVEF